MLDPNPVVYAIRDKETGGYWRMGNDAPVVWATPTAAKRHFSGCQIKNQAPWGKKSLSSYPELEIVKMKLVEVTE